MKPLFADTSFNVALANPRDIHHSDALEIARRRRARIITTEYVMIELGNWLSRTGDRASFLALMEQIDSDRKVTVVPSSFDLFGRGFELYRRRPAGRNPVGVGGFRPAVTQGSAFGATLGYKTRPRWGRIRQVAILSGSNSARHAPVVVEFRKTRPCRSRSIRGTRSGGVGRVRDLHPRLRTNRPSAWMGAFTRNGPT